ncbi:ATP-binding protein [Paenibacillus sp. GD4]|uniref:HD domain-containing protein n=1 Tax=Paenibacillus sp. GD4 TaxID=3068890 RepID=UPI0027969FF9|nr:ATP-binding protein [Paenibacillus sp. GD4]MDQ1910553.1 ATP-binding protein [Paenibacillus sp. GD4]
MTIDPKQEVILQLKESALYKSLVKKSENDHSIKELLALIDNACSEAYQVTKTIMVYMKQYTLHDGDHLFRVLQIMDLLIPNDLIDNTLSPLEIGLLILSAFYHDIGMAPSKDDVDIWTGGKNPSNTNQETQKRAFERYCAGNPSLQKKIEAFHSENKHDEAQILEEHRLSEWIRKTHASRSKQVVLSKKELFKYSNFDFAEILSDICLSHNESNDHIINKQTCVLVAANQYVNVAYICIILRLADILDFDSKRTPKVLFDHLGISNPISLKEWQKHRSIQAWNISDKGIIFSAKCSHPAIEKGIRVFIEDIRKELLDCTHILNQLHYPLRTEAMAAYHLAPIPVVSTQITRETDEQGKEKYKFVDISFNLDQSRIIELLMGTNLYGNPLYSLRELLQNAIDTCRLRSLREEKWGDPYTPKIIIDFKKEEEGYTLQIEDNGLGMDKHILENYFSKIGMSYYRSPEFNEELSDEDRLSFTPISKFGIGFLSAFMVADKVEIDTLRKIGPAKFSEPLNILIEEQSGVFHVKDGDKGKSGTIIKLYLKKNHPFGDPLDKKEDSIMLKYVRDCLRHINIEVEVNTTIYNDTITNVDFNANLVDIAIDEYNIKPYHIQINDEELGIKGDVKCYLLLKNHEFIDEIILTNEILEYNGKNVPFKKLVKMNIGTIEELNKIGDQDFTVPILSSNGFLTINGISVECPVFTNKDKTAETISWPFVVHYDLELTKDVQLNLTASRNNIIFDDTWNNFREKLTHIIAIRLAEEISQPEITRSLVRLLNQTDDSNTLGTKIRDEHIRLVSAKAKEALDF